jgi:hypothetical protein
MRPFSADADLRASLKHESSGFLNRWRLFWFVPAHPPMVHFIGTSQFPCHYKSFCFPPNTKQSGGNPVGIFRDYASGSIGTNPFYSAWTIGR